MAEYGGIGSGAGAANGQGHAESSGSDLPIDTPPSESNGYTIADEHAAEKVPELQASEAVANRRKDEYEVDFE
jgi:hypothetical protein